MNNLYQTMLLNRRISFSVFMVLVMCSAHPGSFAANECTLFQKSVNRFASGLIEEYIKSEDGNVFLSPFSVYVAVAMMATGAKGESFTQMQEAFNEAIPWPLIKQFTKETLEMAMAKGKDGLQDSFGIANAMFVDKSVDVREEYAAEIMDFFKAAVMKMDFKNDKELARKLINQFVAEVTQDMIPEMLTRPLHPQMKMMLLNAIYFRGSWKYAFEENSTYDAVFAVEPGRGKQIKMMWMDDPRFPYYSEDNGDKYLMMPYEADDTAAIFVLPHEKNKLPAISKVSDQLCEILDKLDLPRPVVLDNVAIPRFKFEHKKELVDVLAFGLGITDIFDPNRADFSGITGKKDLHVSRIVHKAHIDVNEMGSEAAAATVDFMSFRSLDSGRPNFFADRPFLFYIVDLNNRIVMFAGRVVDPMP